MWVFCGGMFRSGSTVHYQIASHLVEAAGRGRRIPWHVPEAFGRVRRTAGAVDGFAVFKAHGLTPEMREEVESNGARVITSHRDIRDVVVSAMRKNGWSFRRIWREDRLRYWTRRFEEWANLPGAMVSRYESLARNLEEETRRIAAHLSIPLRDGEAGVIADAYAIQRQQERTEAVRRRRETTGEAVKFDPHSLLHHNHIASGESGGYRAVLRPAEIRAIEDECGDWMERWGYPVDRPPLTTAQRLLRLTYRRVA
jgi:hypothetical protein